MLAVLVNTHRWEEALQQYRKMTELYPELATLHRTGGFILSSVGREAEAIAAFLQADRLAQQPADRMAALEDAARASGLRGYWKERLRQTEARSKQHRVPPTELARLYVSVGEHDAAIRSLEAAYNERAPQLVWLKTAAVWDPLRSDTRFRVLLSRMAFPD
jgi:tetratricopeptide (TPR) repeat protein